MMGSACSSQQGHHEDDGHHATAPGGMEAPDVTNSNIRRRSTLSRLSRRFCGGTQSDSSDEETHAPKIKRSVRHSVDAEVPDQSISQFYPEGDNYDPHPTNPTLRCPKSLTDLCVQTICRSLPNLEGELPPGLPQDIVDRIVLSLTSHSALNSTTLRALSNCELGSLNLYRARGVSDEWFSFCSPGSVAASRQAEVERGIPSSPLLKTISSISNHVGGENSLNYQSPLLSSPNAIEMKRDHDSNAMVECSDSFGSRSTSSFLSAKEEISTLSSTPLLPSALSPPEFFSMNMTSSPTSSLWMHQNGGTSFTEPSDALVRASLLPRKSLQSVTPTKSAGVKSYQTQEVEGMMSHGQPYHRATSTSTPTNSSTSTITLLDLRGSQKLSDRGLLHLAHSPLSSLEVARLDNNHGISGRGLLAFSSSCKLHTLSLSNCRRLTDEAVVNISHLGASLMTLNLGGCRCLTDRSLEAISNLLGLRRLDLSQCDLITDAGLDNLANLDQIEELSLGWCRLISDTGLEILSAQRNRPEVLRALHLARCPLTDDGLIHLSKLVSLEELDLNGCSKLSGLALSSALEKIPCLTSLDVSYLPGILRSSWQGKINALKSLELNYSAVRDSHISRLNYLPQLEELNLDSCLIGHLSIAHLADNNVVPNLKSLDLADTDVSDFSMQKIAQFKNLRSLSLFYCNISNIGLSYLSSMKELEILNLDSREIGDDGLRYLRHLPLKSLDLFSGRITDLGCAYLSKIKTLTSLELCGGGVADLGCAHLATIYNLTSLNLSQNERITNRGAASLAALSNLKALNLSNTSVTSEALKYFSNLSQLQSLAFYGCKDIEDDEKLDSLQSDLPLLRCVRLNNADNEDGVIDHDIDHDSDLEDDNADEDLENADTMMDDTFELDDESFQPMEYNHMYHQLESGDDLRSEEGMSIFRDAHEEEIEDVNVEED